MSEINTIRCGNVNCYIVYDDKNAILVDTGTEKYKEKVLEACKPFHIRLIVLTHGHIDHCQNAAFLAKELKAPIAMNEKDLNLIPDNMQQPLEAKSLLGKLILGISLKDFDKYCIAGFNPTIYLKEGHKLNEFGINATVKELPGHTYGSIGLEVDGDKLIVGDALMNMFYPTLSMLYTNKEQMLKSARHISELGTRKIYFGHGRPVENRIWGKT